MKTQIKQTIYEKLYQMKTCVEREIETLRDSVLLSQYRYLTKETSEGTVWTDALQTALREHERVIIEPSEEAYLIDYTVVIPSGRHIEAEGAVIRLTAGCDLLMLRNENTLDGTHMPIDRTNPDRNISIHGGRWEESHTKRAGYGVSGRYAPHIEHDENRVFFGVSTCMLFNHMENLMLSDMTFAHTAGFSVQIGDLVNGVFENISFESCYADGLHINGGTKNLYISDIAGEVGDDLVALNAYDWQNSSVNFGAIETVLCKNLTLSETSRYKAIRMEPGVYRYDDGSTVDCGLFDIVMKNIKGIRTFKMYLQTPPYALGEKPEWGDVGSVNNVFFEDIALDLVAPIDNFGSYRMQDPLRGAFGAFELGAKIGYLSFENMDLTLHPEEWKYGYFLTIGPKSLCANGKEIFDPYVSSFAETLEFENIRINGENPEEPLAFIKEIAFDDINGDGNSTGKGEIGTILWDGLHIK
ncbi:MAG: hypothetical protein IJ489_10065 [Clostridia bacterium]|nr:hypothetical protein [Clostridia bacterium]